MVVVVLAEGNVVLWSSARVVQFSVQVSELQSRLNGSDGSLEELNKKNAGERTSNAGNVS